MAESRQPSIEQSGFQKTKPSLFDFMTRSAVFSVMLGGFFGSISRAAVFLIIQTAGADIIVNLLGSFFIGFFMFLPPIRDEKENKNGAGLLNKKQFIGTGFLGGFTTFSYFIFGPFSSILSAETDSVEIAAVLTGQFAVQFLIYTIAITALGIIAAAIGKYFAERLTQRKQKQKQKNSRPEMN
ncbi:Putative fluoride ion transporter CrcB [Methanimicrococcus stummii]|uniref:Fluoride-specific ion channel n=1 Tax=Methanimicrococcus stummii TaxID=3028294 RepID=A0AA96V9K6_9EURY|nr:CrcB family protein [Methanimicrococcus sp. Es2]WNY29277.1 Putative fluoride ion transporter CrcB [Methanimicrococcus sp. Es2]